jgi:hypothetical protein
MTPHFFKSRRRHMAEAGVALFVLFLCVLVPTTGWVWNIIKLFNADVITGMEILRGFGIVIPFIGVIVGYF